MSKRHSELRDQYWAENWKKDGILIREFHVVKTTEKQGKRAIDGVIVLDGNPRSLDHSVNHGQYDRGCKQKRHLCIRDKEVVVVQVKTTGLDLPLLGQALFSRELMEVYHGAKVRETVAVCTKNDAALEPIANRCGITVEVL